MFFVTCELRNGCTFILHHSCPTSINLCFLAVTLSIRGRTPSGGPFPGGPSVCGWAPAVGQSESDTANVGNYMASQSRALFGAKGHIY